MMRMSLNRKAWQRWAQERRTAKIRSARVACGNHEIVSHGGVGKAEFGGGDREEQRDPDETGESETLQTRSRV